MAGNGFPGYSGALDSKTCEANRVFTRVDLPSPLLPAGQGEIGAVTVSDG